MGAIVGTAVGVACDGEGIRDGLWGFNASLVGCAIAVFYVPSRASFTLMVAASAAAAVLGAGMSTAFGSAFGVPSLTLPFCIIASVCQLLLIDGTLHGIVGAEVPSGPEENYAHHRAQLKEHRAAAAAMGGHQQHAILQVMDESDGGVRRAAMRVFYGPSASVVAGDRRPSMDRSWSTHGPGGHSSGMVSMDRSWNSTVALALCSDAANTVGPTTTTTQAHAHTLLGSSVPMGSMEDAEGTGVGDLELATKGQSQGPFGQV